MQSKRRTCKHPEILVFLTKYRCIRVRTVKLKTRGTFAIKIIKMHQANITLKTPVYDYYGEIKQI